jgi:aryl-alcohol dehydrogenase-like predicted oxidoreductase
MRPLSANVKSAGAGPPADGPVRLAGSLLTRPTLTLDKFSEQGRAPSGAPPADAKEGRPSGPACRNRIWMEEMQTAQLGRTGPTVSVLGLGCMGMSPGVYGPADEAEGIATIRAAIEAGVTLIDTGDFYGMGHNEMLIRRALEGVPRSKVVISVKFGALRDPRGVFGGNDGRPQAVKNFLAYSLRRLGTDYIDIYRPARLDPAVPIEDTVGAIADMQRAGYVRYVGLSEVGAETIRRAHRAHPICDLQIEYSLMSRGIEAKILPTTRELGIGITAYGTLSRGLLSGRLPPPDRKDDLRIVRMPRYQRGNVERNMQLVEALRQIGQEKGASPAQLAIAWVRSRGTDIVPILGARRRAQLDETLGALAIRLDAADIARIEAAVRPDLTAGTRYDAPQMAHLDSEAHG